MIKNGSDLENRVYPIPEEIDKEIARLKLMAMGVNIDTLTGQQKEYLASWKMGT
jgi:adenosylhomocysteinase